MKDSTVAVIVFLYVIAAVSVEKIGKALRPRKGKLYV